MSAQSQNPVVAGGADVTLRRATSGDLAAVQALLSENKLPLDGVAEHLENFLIAERDGELAGVIGVERHGSYGLLRSAAVREKTQSLGIGRQLVNELLASAREQGVSDLYLLTTTAAEYFPAFGFKAIARSEVPTELSASREFQGACPDSAIAMHLSLI